jgi:hypothetical protein
LTAAAALAPPQVRALGGADADAVRWGDYVGAHAEATLYHTLGWRDFVAEVFGHRPVYLIAERAGRVCGVLPSFVVSLPLLGAKLVSLPYDIGSGGALADDAETERALVAGACEAGRAARVRYVELRCAGERPALAGQGLLESRPVLLSDIAVGTREATWARIKKDQKGSIRMARSRGVGVREATCSADYDAFYEVYLTAFRDFGTPPYGPRYFPELHRRFHASGAVRLLLAEAEGRVVGGLLLFCFGPSWVNKFTACRPDAAALRAPAALYGEALERAVAEGVRRFSMGSSAPHQTGLVEFKERWGAESRWAVAYGAAVLSPPPDLARYFNEAGLAQRAWRRLPLFVTRALGGPLNRWFC